MNKNIFEIWDSIGRVVPFSVRPEYWPVNCAVVVEKIECEKLSYGKAFGYPTQDGKMTECFDYDKRWSNEKLIPSCGSYQWILVRE